MRKSRLNLFKSTSLLISVFGILMLISIIFVAGYVGFSMFSNSITNEISSGTQYDELASLQSEYDDLEANFTAVKSMYQGNATLMNKYDQSLLELTRARTAIENAQSALDSGKPSSEVDSRIDFAREELKVAHEAYNSLL